MAAERCTRSPVQTAALKPKYRSSQPKAVPSIVETVTKSTDDTSLRTDCHRLLSFLSVLFDLFWHEKARSYVQADSLNLPKVSNVTDSSAHKKDG
jgi:hypothetical protein